MPVTNKIFATIYSNSQTLMETTLVGLTNNTFKEVQDLIDLTTAPASVFNGGYSLQMLRIPSIDYNVNATLGYEMLIRLQVAFEINLNNRTSYNNAINDVETILTKRLTSSTFPSAIVENITGSSIEVQNTTADNSSFMIFNLDFTVQGRINLN